VLWGSLPALLVMMASLLWLRQRPTTAHAAG
jgi:hypothetical protein